MGGHCIRIEQNYQFQIEIKYFLQTCLFSILEFVLLTWWFSHSLKQVEYIKSYDVRADVDVFVDIVCSRWNFVLDLVYNLI